MMEPRQAVYAHDCGHVPGPRIKPARDARRSGRNYKGPGALARRTHSSHYSPANMSANVSRTSIVAEKEQAKQASQEDPGYLKGSALWLVMVGSLLAIFLYALHPSSIVLC